MSIIRKGVFTIISLMMALLILAVDQIDGFDVLAPADKYYIDVLVALLLAGMGILLDINLQKLSREKEFKLDLLKVNRDLAEVNAALQRSLNESRVLKGLLPICSSCKKIRDDQGCWQRLEQYIQNHSEAEFSHGICPECAGKLYGLKGEQRHAG